MSAVSTPGSGGFLFSFYLHLYLPLQEFKVSRFTLHARDPERKLPYVVLCGMEHSFRNTSEGRKAYSTNYYSILVNSARSGSGSAHMFPSIHLRASRAQLHTHPIRPKRCDTQPTQPGAAQNKILLNPFFFDFGEAGTEGWKEGRVEGWKVHNRQRTDECGGPIGQATWLAGWPVGWPLAGWRNSIPWRSIL